MIYGLANELWKAGFPQNHIWVEGGMTTHCVKCASSKTLVEYEACRPTLSELIEACGTDFMLTNECGVWEAWQGSLGYPVRMGEAGAKHEVEGKTPEEAVARLWLALNKKP